MTMGIFKGSNRREDRHAQTQNDPRTQREFLKNMAREAQRLAAAKAAREAAAKREAERVADLRKRAAEATEELRRHTRVRNNRREY